MEKFPPTSPDTDIPIAQLDPSLIDPSQAEGLNAVRNQAIEAVLDPEGSLPQLTLVDSYERSMRAPNSGIDVHQYALVAGGNVIGRARVSNPYGTKARNQGMVAKIDMVEITDEGYLGKGYGKATYLEMLKSLPPGFELTCDDRGVSPSALKMWQWLESRGLAERPVGAEAPVMVFGEDGKQAYQGLGYKTCLNALTEFAEAA